MADSAAQKARTQGSPNLVGTIVGRFAVQRLLGTGGMGQVYRAEDTRLKRLVALKRMAPQFSADEHYRRRFLKEAECASRLSHQSIAGVYDVIEDRGEIFLVMEYVEGETLRDKLKNPLRLDEVIEIAVQCATALVAAQSQGIVHRDLKPENIMLTSSLQVKILDFGVAKALPRADESTTQEAPGTTGGMAGTPAYMAPETLLEKRTDGRSDIFSLGVTFYEALTGQHPFLADSFLDTAQRILHHAPTPANLVNAKVPAELARILNKMLSKDPAERYATSADLLVDLRALQRATALPMLTPPAGTSLQEAPFPALASLSLPQKQGDAAAAKKHHWGMWFLVGVLAGVGIAAGVYWPRLRPLLPPRIQSIFAHSPTQSSSAVPSGSPATSAPPVAGTPAAATPAHPGSMASSSSLRLAGAVSGPVPANKAAEGSRSPTATARESAVAPRRGSYPLSAQVDLLDEVTGARAALSGPDGKSTRECTTPCSFKDLHPGRYTIELRKGGYRTLQSAFALHANQVLSESLQLEPQSASLVIKSDPSRAEVFIDGKRQTSLTPATFSVSPGKHTVAVEKDGVGRRETTIQLDDNEIGGLTVPLRGQSSAPATAADGVGQVEVRTVPPGADILVDGVSMGKKTPCDLKLPAGHHTLTLYLKSYTALKKDINVEANHTLPLDEVLVKPQI